MSKVVKLCQGRELQELEEIQRGRWHYGSARQPELKPRLSLRGSWVTRQLHLPGLLGGVGDCHGCQMSQDMGRAVVSLC